MKIYINKLSIDWILRNRRHLGVYLLLFLFSEQMLAQRLDSTCYKQLSDFPFVIVSSEYVEAPPEISDSLFDLAARGIRFKVNRTELQPSDPFIALYREKLVPWLKSKDLHLRQLYVKGAASPEGPYWNNVRLSRGRTRRLLEFLCSELGDTVCNDDLPISAKNVTEDYGLLVKMMGQAHDPDYDRVNSIWLKCEGDEACCKKSLMALDNGKVWKRLLKTYFPALRQSRVILWFSCRKSINIEPTTLQAASVTPQLADIRRLDISNPVSYTRRHLIAARTNLLHDLLYMPQFGWAPGFNIQLEYYPLRGHYTYNAGFTWTTHRHWNDNKFFQIRDLQLELRRYFKGGGAFIGPYLGVYAEGTVYGIGFSKTRGWEGEGGGGGLTAGWTWKLNRKGNLRLEVSASLGVFVTRYDPYVYGNPITGSEEDGLYYYDYRGNTSEFKKRNHRMVWFGPTNAGLHITYDIIYRKKKPVFNPLLQKGGGR